MSDDADRPPLRRRLIVNADDFGQSPGVNDGVARAHQQGIVTSASLMVRWPAAKAAAAYARQYPDLSLGLHVDLGEWEHRGESWVPMYAVVDTEDVPAVEQELRRQLETFRDLTGRDPTHLDSHQHVHRTATLLPVFRALALKTEAFLREEPHGIRYDGHFYGWDGYGGWVPGATDVAALVGIIESLGPGVTELGCHPGLGADMSSSYREERSVETATLCDPRVVDAIIANGVELVSFHDVRGRPRPLRPDRAPEQQLV